MRLKLLILSLIAFFCFNGLFAKEFKSQKEFQNIQSKAFADSTHPYALIAGGSKGIGYAIAEALASRNYNLILIARGIDTLVAAKQRLESAYPIKVEIIAKDLSFDK